MSYWKNNYDFDIQPETEELDEEFVHWLASDIRRDPRSGEEALRDAIEQSQES